MRTIDQFHVFEVHLIDLRRSLILKWFMLTDVPTHSAQSSNEKKIYENWIVCMQLKCHYRSFENKEKTKKYEKCVETTQVTMKWHHDQTTLIIGSKSLHLVLLFQSKFDGKTDNHMTNCVPSDVRSRFDHFYFGLYSFTSCCWFSDNRLAFNFVHYLPVLRSICCRHNGNVIRQQLSYISILFRCEYCFCFFFWSLISVLFICFLIHSNVHSMTTTCVRALDTCVRTFDWIRSIE